jgi:hypothetical protein
VSTAGEAPFDAWIAHWLHDEPELRLARVFADTDPRRDALFGVERELAESAYGVRDAGVAQARLGWWLEECTALAARGARHPLTRELQARAGDDVVPIASALGRAFTAAFALVESESIGTPEELAALDHATFAPLVRLRARADVPEAALRAATTARLLLELRNWPRFAQPARARVPLQALARAGVDRASAAEGAAAVAAQAATLAPLADALAADPSRLGSLDAARVVVARRLVAARRGGLLGERAGSRFGLLLALWRQAVSHRSTASR